MKKQNDLSEIVNGVMECCDNPTPAEIMAITWMGLHDKGTFKELINKEMERRKNGQI